jgi:putative transposase
MLTGRRYRLSPTPGQAKTLAQWIGCVRSVYNSKVEEERYLAWLRRRAIFSPSWTGVPEGEKPGTIDQAFGHLKGEKTEQPWLHEVPAQLYRNAIVQWKQAWANHWRNPEHFRRPDKRHRGENDSIWLTRELFSVEGKGRIQIGTKTRALGVFCFKQHRRFRAPASVTITCGADGRWWLSLAFEDGIAVKSEEMILAEVATLPAGERDATVVGHDRGVVRTVQTSEGACFALNEGKHSRIVRWNRRIRTLNKKLARQDKASKRRAKTKRKLARTHSRLADLRRDHAHQVSRRLVDGTQGRVLVFEDLKLSNMTRRPKPRLAEDGTGFAPNGARAKAGLNRSLLNQALGKILLFTRYKAARAGKLVLTVPAHFSSQECSCCGHTSPANRKSQARFHCEACGHSENADANASAVIKKRGIAALDQLLFAPGRGASQLPVEAARRKGSLSPRQGANEAGVRSTHLAA